MIGKILIHGEIGSEIDRDGNIIVKGVDLMDVVEQWKAQKETAQSFEVEIDSPGGYCHVGHSIYEFLKTIQQPVTTIAVNQCASIATIIFLAGERRVATCPLMIHNPWNVVQGDADQIQKEADELRTEEDKIISIYSKHTGLEKIALDALMKIETYIPPEKAVTLGFATETGEATAPTNILKAVAKFKNEPMSAELKSLDKKVEGLTKMVKDFFSKNKPKGLTVADGSGKNLEIMNADGSDLAGNPTAGCTVMIDGVPAPDGDYTIPSLNMKITVASGIISTVAEASQEMTLELLSVYQRSLFESKSQLVYLIQFYLFCCCRYIKDRYLKANHNLEDKLP